MSTVEVAPGTADVDRTSVRCPVCSTGPRLLADLVRYLGRRLPADEVEHAAAEVLAERQGRAGRADRSSWLPIAAEVVGRRQVLGALTTGDEVLDAALARLSPDDREVVLLATWDQFDDAELAGVLACAPRAAARRRQAALHRFEQALLEADQPWTWDELALLGQGTAVVAR